MMTAMLVALAAAQAPPPIATTPQPMPPAALPPGAAPAPPGPAPQRLTFDEAVRRALAAGTSAIVAAEEVRRAEGLLWQARSTSLPSLVGAAFYTRLDSDRASGTGPSRALIAAKDQRSANAILTVPLVAPSRWYQWSSASEAVEVARAAEGEARRDAALTAARAYLTIIAQRRALDVVIRARDTAKAHLDFARARRAAGVGNALDELRAEQEYETDAAQVDAAVAALARAREALGVLVGADAPVEAAEEPQLAGAGEPREVARDAETRRQDVVAARARARAAENVVRGSWNDWLPILFASGQGFYQDPGTASLPANGWQAQLILSWSLFEGGLRVGQGRERQALLEESRAQLDGVLRQARSDVRLAFETLLQSEAALDSSRRAADRARAVLDLSTQAYKAGALNSLDVIDAERRARDADTAAVVAEDAVRQSRLDLLAAAGRFP